MYIRKVGLAPVACGIVLVFETGKSSWTDLLFVDAVAAMAIVAIKVVGAIYAHACNSEWMLGMSVYGKRVLKLVLW